MPRQFTTLSLTCSYCGLTFSRYTQNLARANSYCSPTCHNRALVRPIGERFWSKVDCSGGKDACWPWTGGKFDNGYGRFMDSNRQELAHRVSYRLTYGDSVLPPDIPLLHSCPGGDRKDCVNPAHLAPGSCHLNHLQASERGQLIVGENHHMSKLKPDDVRAIRMLRSTTALSRQAIARRFDVSSTTIRAILIGYTWKHVH